MATSTLLPGHVLEVDENGTSDVASRVLVTPVAPLEIPAKVDDPEIGIVGMSMQPGSVDEGAESHLSVMDAGVVAEMHRARHHRLHLLERSHPVCPVRVLPGPVAEV